MEKRDRIKRPGCQSRVDQRASTRNMYVCLAYRLLSRHPIALGIADIGEDSEEVRVFGTFGGCAPSGVR